LRRWRLRSAVEAAGVKATTWSSPSRQTSAFGVLHGRRPGSRSLDRAPELFENAFRFGPDRRDVAERLEDRTIDRLRMDGDEQQRPEVAP
jgi:hypothetical protein